jgi:hypothetical protein
VLINVARTDQSAELGQVLVDGVAGHGRGGVATRRAEK